MAKTKEEREELEKRVSPVGTALPFACVQVKDKTYDTYKITLQWTPESEDYDTVDALCSEMDEMAEAALNEAAKAFKPSAKVRTFERKMADMPYKRHENGDIQITFKKKGSWKDKNDDDKLKPTSPPPLYDAKGQRITELLKIGEGSRLKVSFTMEGFYKPIGASVSIKLLGSKLIELVEWVGKGLSADELGLSEEEDGYEVEGAELSEEIDTPSASPAPTTAAPKKVSKPKPEPVEEEEEVVDDDDAPAPEVLKKAAKLAAKPAPKATAKPAAAPTKPAPKATKASTPAKAAPKKAAPVVAEDDF